MAVRVVEMIRQGISPANILALSFTNKAAAELEERIGRIYWGSRAQDRPPVDLSKLTVSTFHSLGELIETCLSIICSSCTARVNISDGFLLCLSARDCTL